MKKPNLYRSTTQWIFYALIVVLVMHFNLWVYVGIIFLIISVAYLFKWIRNIIFHGTIEEK